jgi:hypothetical protein
VAELKLKKLEADLAQGAGKLLRIPEDGDQRSELMSITIPK